MGQSLCNAGAISQLKCGLNITSSNVTGCDPGWGCATNLAIGSSIGQAVCKGDSGGPVYLQQAGAIYPKGIAQGGVTVNGTKFGSTCYNSILVTKLSTVLIKWTALL